MVDDRHTSPPGDPAKYETTAAPPSLISQLWHATATPSNSSRGTFNPGVDFVITFAYGTTKDKTQAEAQLKSLLAALDRVGMQVAVRDGLNGKLLVFVKIESHQRLVGEAYRSRVKDWLHGVRPAAPDSETRRSLDKEPLTEAERLRIIYAKLTDPKVEGGAGITAGEGSWTLVEAIFPLHDIEFNKTWVASWSTQWSVNMEQLDDLRNMFGEKVAFYFVFLQAYFSFLIVATALGIVAYFILPQDSPVFVVANCLWSIVFVEYWKRRERDLAVHWNVRNVSQLQTKRVRFQPEIEVRDPVTGEVVEYYPAWKRLLRQSLQVPFALAASAILCALFACVFTIEVFITEVYSGAFKSVLMFLPAALLAVLVPIFTGALSRIAARLTDFENYENESSYEVAMTQKVFVFNFMCSYVPIFLTAFVYEPFGSVLVPHLDVLGMMEQAQSTGEKAVTPFQIDPDRLSKQLFYFTVTAQAVNLAMETIVPVLKRRLFKKAKEFRRKDKTDTKEADGSEESQFLTRVREECELSVYNVTDDLRWMCMQFGYLCLFATIWPLAAFPVLVNNWIELRSDAAKICLEMRRPVPHRADSIGPWLSNLSFLTWMGSLTSAALVYLSAGPTSKEPHIGSAYTVSGLLATIFLSEHLYFIGRLVVRTVLSKFDSPGLIKERREKYIVRRRFLRESAEMDKEIDISQVARLPPTTPGSTQSGFWDGQTPEAALELGLNLIHDSKKNA